MTDDKLTAQQEKTVLAVIDDAGADAWDEGDYQWKFKSVHCDFKTGRCTFGIEIVDPASGGRPERRFAREGSVDGVARYADLVETFANGGQSIAGSLFTKLQELTSKLEKEIPAR